MVARIKTSSSLLRTLNYNEKKVKEGKAICIHAENYLKAAADLRFEEKFNRLANLASLHPKIRSNSIHISLNFHPDEHPTVEMLREIATMYMHKIGFGDQPYLVYQHMDTYHCHLHIVSTTVTAKGQRMQLYNLGRNESSRARLEIEKTFGLRAANEQIKRQMKDHKENLRPFMYGKMEMKQAMNVILKTILPNYRYSSIEQLNAVLFFYHLKADTGEKGSLLERTGGLYYRGLDKEGAIVGPPIKASSFPFPSTLSYLETRFSENKRKKSTLKAGTMARIEWALKKQPKTINAFVLLLKKEEIDTRLYENKLGSIYGISFIDHRNQSVFGGSELGKMYSYAHLKNRIYNESPIAAPLLQASPIDDTSVSGDFKTNHSPSKIIEELLTPLEWKEGVPYPLRKRKRKGKK